MKLRSKEGKLNGNTYTEGQVVVPATDDFKGLISRYIVLEDRALSEFDHAGEKELSSYCAICSENADYAESFLTRKLQLVSSRENFDVVKASYEASSYSLCSRCVSGPDP